MFSSFTPSRTREIVMALFTSRRYFPPIFGRKNSRLSSSLKFSDYDYQWSEEEQRYLLDEPRVAQYALSFRGNVDADFVGCDFKNYTHEYGPVMHIRYGDYTAVPSLLEMFGDYSGCTLNLSFYDCNFNGNAAAYDGGAIYMELGKVIDGFVFADNDASTGNGGAVCNMSNSATVSNCRFYRNTCEDDGGAVYTEGEAVENCKFFGNDCSGRGYELYSYFGSTEINDCTFTSNYTDESAVVNGKQSNCAFLTEKDYTLSGNGSQNDPYLIKTTDDWDALHYMMLKRSRMSFSDGTEQIYGNEYNFYGKHFRLDDDITVYSTVGEAQYNKSFGIVGGPTYTLYHEFNGIFDGNGHTVTCYMYDDDEGEKAAFGYANSATVTNLTVDGYIRGTYSVGGIFGNAYNCTAEKCVNNATVYGVNDYVGGIAGYSAISEFDNCTNNGKVTAKGKRAGGIIGSADGASIRNCTVFGDVTAYIFAGGLIGYEANAVTAENNIIDCKVTGTASAARYPAEGDYVIYSASDPDFCFDIQDASNENGVYLRLRTPENCSANVFTLAYDVQNDCYTIAAKHSGRLLTVDVITASQDWASVYQYWVEDRLLARQRWIFESTGSENCCYIRSVSSFPQWYMNVANGDVTDGSYIIAYKNHGNDSFRLAPKSDQVMRPVLADGIKKPLDLAFGVRQPPESGCRCRERFRVQRTLPPLPVVCREYRFLQYVRHPVVEGFPSLVQYVALHVRVGLFNVLIFSCLSPCTV